jgi:hypothetical protein
VPSIPLIAASVMSKKLAVETDLILLDVKAGSGAFMKTPEAANELARSCAALAADWGRSARVVVTDMSQPLGDAIGNAPTWSRRIEVPAESGAGGCGRPDGSRRGRSRHSREWDPTSRASGRREPLTTGRR